MAGERAANPRRFRPAVAAAAVVILLSLPLTGCGGGDDSTTASAGATGAAGASGATGTGGSKGGEPGTPNDQQSTSGVSDPAAVQATIGRALATDSADAACKTFVTPRYVKSAYGSEQGCLDAVKTGGVASDVDVSGIKVNGETARATATPTGGPNDGEKLEVSLVQEGGTWKVDSVESNAPVGP